MSWMFFIRFTTSKLSNKSIKKTLCNIARCLFWLSYNSVATVLLSTVLELMVYTSSSWLEKTKAFPKLDAIHIKENPFCYTLYRRMINESQEGRTAWKIQWITLWCRTSRRCVNWNKVKSYWSKKVNCMGKLRQKGRIVASTTISTLICTQCGAKMYVPRNPERQR